MLPESSKIPVATLRGHAISLLKVYLTVVLTATIVMFLFSVVIMPDFVLDWILGPLVIGTFFFSSLIEIRIVVISVVLTIALLGYRRYSA